MSNCPAPDRLRRLFDATPEDIGPLAEDSDLVLSFEDLLPRLEKEDAIAARIAQLHLLSRRRVRRWESPGGAYRKCEYARAWLSEAPG